MTGEGEPLCEKKRNKGFPHFKVEGEGMIVTQLGEYEDIWLICANQKASHGDRVDQSKCTWPGSWSK